MWTSLNSLGLRAADEKDDDDDDEFHQLLLIVVSHTATKHFHLY